MYSEDLFDTREIFVNIRKDLDMHDKNDIDILGIEIHQQSWSIDIVFDCDVEDNMITCYRYTTVKREENVMRLSLRLCVDGKVAKNFRDKYSIMYNDMKDLEF